MTKPKIICLCGSTRFTGEMLVVKWEFEKQRNIVLSWNLLPSGYSDGEQETHLAEKEGVKEILDELHFRKMDLADEVFVVNINGYIGESTTNEVAYAESLGKPIRWLEPRRV